MKLVLVRHGEAEHVHGGDAERALTMTGREQAVKTGKWLKKILADEGQVRLLASPYRRARETADIIAGFLGAEPVEVAAITPDHDPRIALTAVAAAVDCECVVVVTHMPLVAAMASWIESGTLLAAQPFALAEARLFDVSVLAVNAASEQSRYVPALA
ncbi:MAG: histidine phosphatase family protein [bacterium]|nr:histidine phosphatase family protein [bacterium]